MRQLLMIRHGETAWNREERIQGQLDAPLNERGRAQAQALAQALARELDETVCLVASDLSRARDTAEPLGELLSVPIALEPRFRERHFGALEGRLHAEWRAEDPQGVERFRNGDPDYAPPGGEDSRALEARVVAAVEDWVGRGEAQTLVVVTHGGVVSAFYRWSERLGWFTPRTWSIPNASVSRWRIECDPSGARRFICERLGERLAAVDEALAGCEQ
ncbi:MAG: histidine phosphatase family protein [Casimicrobiaceae bacterium]|nr:histidine phosphatase family protein [Casimicrobiaceae bacterium]